MEDVVEADVLTPDNALTLDNHLSIIHPASDPISFRILYFVTKLSDEPVSEDELSEILPDTPSGDEISTHVNSLCDAQLIYRRNNGNGRLMLYDSGLGILAVNTIQRLFEREREISDEFR